MNLAIEIPLILVFLVAVGFLGWAMLMGLKVDFHFMKDEADKLPTRKRHAY